MILSLLKRFFNRKLGKKYSIEGIIVTNYLNYPVEIFTEDRGWVSYNDLHGVIKNG